MEAHVPHDDGRAGRLRPRLPRLRGRRLAIGISLPVVFLFIGLMGALLVPTHIFVLTEAMDRLGLLGPRLRIEGLAPGPPADRDAPPLWIVNGRLWDAKGGLRANPGLGCQAGRLTFARPEGARVLDATGRIVIPGLFDMHVHAMGGAFDGEMMIAHGVTAARDVGSDLSSIIARRLADESGRRLGPRLRVAGPYLVGVEAQTDQQVAAPDPGSAVAVVARLADAGVDGVKVHGGIDEATLRAVAGAARSRGLWLAAHLDRVGALEAARLGVTTIEHGSGIDWESGGPEAETARDRLARDLAATGAALTPTLVVAEHAFRLHRLVQEDDPSLRYFPWLVRRGWIASQIASASAARLSAEEEARRHVRLRRLQRFVAAFAGAGGRVLAGSDAPAFLVAHGHGLHRELELLEEAGLSWQRALAAATVDAAAALGMQGEAGLLEPGLRADLALVDGDFERDGVAAIRTVSAVVMNGRLLLDRRFDSAGTPE